jgi:hypothetical protein
MLGKMKDSIRRSPIRTIPLVVFVLLLTAATNVYTIKEESDNLNTQKERIEEQHKDQEWNEIEALLSSTNVGAKQNSKYLAQKIEVELVKEYPDLDDLKKEFDTKDFTDKFYDILQSNLLQENSVPSSIYPVPFHTTVGIRDGVIAIFSNESTSTRLTNPEGSKMVEWDKLVSRNPNPKLADEAIQSVLRRESSVIFLQSGKSKHGDLEKETDMSMETLEKAYKKYGMDGLRKYSLLSPSYITENGDVFNIDDKTFMRDNPNYKIIVIQGFNIAEILDKYNYVFYENDKDFTEQTSFIENFVLYKHIKAITWSLIIFILCMWLINIYNSDKKKYYRRAGDKPEIEIEGDIKEKNKE